MSGDEIPERGIAFCWPADMRSVARIPGTTTSTCARCGCRVLVAPSTTLAAWHVTTVCIFCGTPDEFAEALNDGRPVLTDEQRAELRAYLDRRRRR